MNESSPNSVCYEGQSAFDVADMVKQYFRDLPEPIFTSRLCESFLHIYQCRYQKLWLSNSSSAPLGFGCMKLDRLGLVLWCFLRVRGTDESGPD